MSSSNHLTVPAALDSPSRSSFNSAEPDAATSERNLSDGSLHYYSTEDEAGPIQDPYKIIPIRQVITSLQQYQEDLGAGSGTIIFPSRLGGPTEMPIDSVNAHFPRSGPHRWFGNTDVEKTHPLHGHAFSLYYGPHFRKPRYGWTGNERTDWLRYLWDWRPAKEHRETTFDAWLHTRRAEELWRRRLTDKACEYYVQYGTVQGTVLEQREHTPKEQWEGPTNEFEPDIYCLRSYLKRIELGQGNQEDIDGTSEGGEEHDQEKGCTPQDGPRYARSSRSEISGDDTSSVSESIMERTRARRMERQFKGIKAPPSSLRDPTPDAPSIHERRRSRLQSMKSALMSVWSSVSIDDENPPKTPSISGSTTPFASPSGPVTPRTPTAGSGGQESSTSGRRSSQVGEYFGIVTGGRRRSRANTGTPAWPFQ